MRRPRNMSSQDWECKKSDRKCSRALRAWDARIRQEIKVGGARVVSGYNPDGSIATRRFSVPCTFDPPWPKVFRVRSQDEDEA